MEVDSVNYMYFRVQNTTDTQLWRTDGTQLGTTSVYNIVVSTPMVVMADANGVNSLYFRGYDGVFESLWKSDGIVGGETERVQSDLAPFELTIMADANGVKFFCTLVQILIGSYGEVME